jgi:hypothetical protein
MFDNSIYFYYEFIVYFSDAILKRFYFTLLLTDYDFLFHI